MFYAIRHAPDGRFFVTHGGDHNAYTRNMNPKNYINHVSLEGAKSLFRAGLQWRKPPDGAHPCVVCIAEDIERPPRNMLIGDWPDFSLTELLIVTACLATLAAILLPCLATARAAAQSAACLANVRQIGQALALYTQDYDDALPVYADFPLQSPAWWNVLPAYSGSTDLFRCPAAVDSWGEDFAVNYAHVIRYPAGFPWVMDPGPAHEGEFARPAETLVLADGGCGALYCPQCGVSNAPDWGLAARHRGGVNCLWLDGHGSYKKLQSILDWSFWGHSE